MLLVALLITIVCAQEDTDDTDAEASLSEQITNLERAVEDRGQELDELHDLSERLLELAAEESKHDHECDPSEMGLEDTESDPLRPEPSP